ncbi:MAG: transporter substrate-binding domain-containing protein, partial [Peptococcaceae bacterium]|nr:transporter substrate-binding domain-containing protein [Peptococcaceae bacterium]
MRTKTIFIIFVVTCICLAAMGSRSSGAAIGIDKENENAEYVSDYRNIPGVSKEDIQDIEELKQKKEKFTFGTIISSEAFVNSDGSHSGFSIVLCAMLSDMFGIPFEHQFYEWEELFAALDNKQLDFSGELTMTTTRLQHYFMTGTLYERTIKIFTNRYAPDIKKIKEIRPLKFAFLKNTVTDEQIKRVTDPDIRIEMVYVENYDVAAEQLRLQEIDAFIEEAPAMYCFESYDFIEAEDYFPLLYSPISISTANLEYEPIIRVLKKYLATCGTYYLSELYAQGNNDYMIHKFNMSLTDEERAYIGKIQRENEAVKVVAESDNYPISFYNDREKEFQGIAPDVLKEMSALTGIKFVPVNEPNEPLTALTEMVQTGQAAMIAGMMLATETGGDGFLWADNPFSSDRSALLTTAEHADIYINQIPYVTVGQIKDSIHENIYDKWFVENGNSKYYYTLEDAFQALRNGDVDFIMASENSLLNQTNYREDPGFKSSIVFDRQLVSSFAFNTDEELLRSVISKAQLLLDLETINNHWRYKAFDYQSKRMKDSIPYILLFFGILVLAVIALLLIYLKNRRLGKNLEKLVQIRTNEIERQAMTLTAIFSTIPDLIYCRNLEGNFTRCNDSFEQYVGNKEEDIIGRSYEMLFVDSRDAQEEHSDVDAEVIRTKSVKVIEENIYSPRYRVSRLFETIRTPLIRNGKVVGIMGIARDITERKAIEMMAMAASQAKSNFLAQISHEIRTPLNAIIGMTHIAKNSVKDESKTLDSLEEITVASSHLLKILNDVLDLSKIEAGRFEISREPFRLLSIFASISSIVSQRCQEKKITFKTNIDELPDIYLVGDELRLNQVLINILSNAVKFTDVGGDIDLRVEMVRQTPAEAELAFAVSDNGIGMSAEQLEKIFVAFEQSDRTIASRFGGTGLGLAISKNLVNYMGGTITVESTPQVGSTFSFTLVFPKAGAKPEAQPPAPVDVLNLSGKRILLAEDVEINRIILRELLVPMNIMIEEAEDGQQALNMFTRSPSGYYDLIFMDIQMPVMDGYETTQKIRGLTREDAKTVPILAMTANAYTEDVNKGIEMGMNGHIAKPIDLNVVLRTLADF